VNGGCAAEGTTAGAAAVKVLTGSQFLLLQGCQQRQ